MKIQIAPVIDHCKESGKDIDLVQSAGIEPNIFILNNQITLFILNVVWMYVNVLMFYHKNKRKFDILSKDCNEVENCVLVLHGCMT